jgi:hypothetical protein
MYILCNQRDATYTLFFIIIGAVHVSGGFSAHHQELIKLYAQPHQRYTAEKHENTQGCAYSFISS